MAIYTDKLGQDSFEYQQKSHQSCLLDLKKNGKTRVKINAPGCYSSCMKLHNLVLPLSKAIRILPVQNPRCGSILYSANIWCISIFHAAKENDVESLKLPLAVLSIPKLPLLTNVVATDEGKLPASNQRDFGNIFEEITGNADL